jgi:hypothetical protein
MGGGGGGGQINRGFFRPLELVVSTSVWLSHKLHQQLGVPVKAKNRVSVHLPFSYSNYSHENNLCNCSASAQSEFTFHQNPIVSTGRWKLKIVSTKIC